MQKLEPAVRTLRLLQVIAEGDGLVQAAGKIGLSQSAASHAIAALERSLGVQLFARNSGQLRLSRIGEQILPRVRQILGSLDAIAEEIVSESGVQNRGLTNRGCTERGELHHSAVGFNPGLSNVSSQLLSEWNERTEPRFAQIKPTPD